MPVTHIPRDGRIDVTFTLSELRALAACCAGVLPHGRDHYASASLKVYEARDALASANNHQNEEA